MKRLPPFDALIAFEATIRLGGMTRAAGELGVTQSAISHRIRRLEQFMEVPLFVRANAGPSLTPAGQALLNGLAEIFSAMGELRSRCLIASAPNRLRVGVGSALADNWLVRRLPAFSTRHPEIGIELVVVENEAPERMADSDIRILWVRAENAQASTTQRPLFREHVFPVCHPSLLAKGDIPSGALVLPELPLLHKRALGYQAGEEWQWTTWFDRLGLTEQPKEAIRFSAIGPAISAAMQGAGIVLARSMLVDDALADGRLVRVLPEAFDALSSKLHVARWPARLCGDPRVLAFVAWLVEAADRTSRIRAGGKHSAVFSG